ncbi:MAG TPA: hypothetical protein VJN02_06540 [Gammaproteobacteria bacterium]|nr:hypothetical protein [Gammaproteobacteria bacterium]
MNGRKKRSLHKTTRKNLKPRKEVNQLNQDIQEIHLALEDLKKVYLTLTNSWSKADGLLSKNQDDLDEIELSNLLCQIQEKSKRVKNLAAKLKETITKNTPKQKIQSLLQTIEDDFSSRSRKIHRQKDKMTNSIQKVTESLQKTNEQHAYIAKTLEEIINQSDTPLNIFLDPINFNQLADVLGWDENEKQRWMALKEESDKNNRAPIESLPNTVTNEPENNGDGDATIESLASTVANESKTPVDYKQSLIVDLNEREKNIHEKYIQIESDLKSLNKALQKLTNDHITIEEQHFIDEATLTAATNTLNQAENRLNKIVEQISSRQCTEKDLQENINRFALNEKYKKDLENLIKEAALIGKSQELTSKEIADLDFSWNIDSDFETQNKKLETLINACNQLSNCSILTDISIITTKANALKDQMNGDYQNHIPTKIEPFIKILDKKITALSENNDKLLNAIRHEQFKLIEIEEEKNRHMALLCYHHTLSSCHEKISTLSNPSMIVNECNKIIERLGIDDESLKIIIKICERIVLISHTNTHRLVDNKQLKTFTKNIESFIENYLANFQNQISHPDIFLILMAVAKINGINLLKNNFVKRIIPLINFNQSTSPVDDIEICAALKINIEEFIHEVSEKKYDDLLDEEKLRRLIAVCQEQNIPGDEHHLEEKLEYCLIQRYMRNLNPIKNMGELIVLFNELTGTIKIINNYDMLLALEATFRKIYFLYKKENKRVKNSINNIMSIFHDVLLGCSREDGHNASSQHQTLIIILQQLNNIPIDLSMDNKILIMNFLCFEHKKNQDEPSSISDQLLVCARAGLDIKQTVVAICNQSFINQLDTAGIAKLIFACYLHDANSKLEENRIPQNLIKCFLNRANDLYSCVNKSDSEIIQKMLYANQKDKFSNLALREVEFATYLVQAAAYYQYEFDEKTETSLFNLIHLNDEKTISPLQEQLFNFLKEQLKGYNHLEIILEKTLVGGISADIYIRDTITGKQFDVELDGRDYHFYKNLDFSPSDRQLYKNIARDETLKKHGYMILRMTKEDFDITILPPKMSPKLSYFISFVKNHTSPIHVSPTHHYPPNPSTPLSYLPYPTDPYLSHDAQKTTKVHDTYTPAVYRPAMLIPATCYLLTQTPTIQIVPSRQQTATPAYYPHPATFFAKQATVPSKYAPPMTLTSSNNR